MRYEFLPKLPYERREHLSYSVISTELKRKDLRHMSYTPAFGHHLTASLYV